MDIGVIIWMVVLFIGVLFWAFKPKRQNLDRNKPKETHYDKY